MKGGVFVKAGTYENNIISMIQNGNVQQMQTVSVGGFLFTVTVPPAIETNLVKVYPGANPPTNPLIRISNLIIKLVLINDDPALQVRTTINFGINPPFEKDIVSEQEFRRECQIQKSIYIGSLDARCDPICLYPIYTDIILLGNPAIGQINPDVVPMDVEENDAAPMDVEEQNQIYTEMSNKSQLFEYLMNHYKTGIIVMENLADSHQISSYFPGWSEHNTYENYNYNNPNDIKLWAMINYLYTLYRLKKLGWIHGDTHLQNALCIDNYNYIGQKKVFLIDFGYTTADPNPPGNNIARYANDNGNNYFSYRAFYNFYTQILNGNRSMISFDGVITNITNMNIFKDLCKKYVLYSFISFLQNIIQYNIRLELNNLYQINVGLFNPAIIEPNWWVFNQIISPLRERKWIFDQAGFDEQNVAGAIAVPSISLNPACNCCLIGDKYINYMRNFPFYTNHECDTISLNIQNYIDITMDGLQLTNSAPLAGNPPSYRLWVIGTGADNILHFYTIKVQTCLEIATKHLSLIRYCGIQTLYAAGEMEYIHNANNTFTINFNLSSGTYMYAYYMQRVGNNAIAFNEKMFQLGIISRLYINNTVIPYGNYVVNHINIPGHTYIQSNNFCNNPLSLQYIVLINQLYINFSGMPLLTQYNTEQQCRAQLGGNDKESIIDDNLKNEILMAKYELNSCRNNDNKEDYLDIPDDIIKIIKGTTGAYENINSVYKYTLMLKSLLSQTNANISSSSKNALSVTKEKTRSNGGMKKQKRKSRKQKRKPRKQQRKSKKQLRKTKK
jgi:hypothetical protein